jgi:trimeric autotransporter adhesin
LQTHKLPVVNLLASFFCVIAGITLAMLAGCGQSGSTNVPSVALGGSVQGGRQPISGSSIQLYAVGTGGNGSAAQALLSAAVTSDSSGNFAIPASYTCPSASTPVYVVASGGSPASSSAANPALVLMAMLGPCGSLPSGSITVNEVTTVGSVWPLAAYITDAAHLGSASGDASFLAAIATVPEFVSMAQGTSPGTAAATSYFAEGSKLYSLADILSDCVSSGGGSSCGTLFSTVTPSGTSAPSNTLTAALSIAQNPKNNVTGIYGLQEANSPFEPALTSAPADWTLALSSAVATPSISPATGDYTGAQQVTISDATAGSAIYYTTDGTAPTASSHAYTGPISIAVTSTVQAIAVLQGSQSAVASSTLTITAPAAPTPGDPATKLAFLQQPSSAAVGATISPAVTVAIEDANGHPITSATNPVTLALTGGSGLAGTLTATPQNGVATFSNLSVGTAGSYTLAATSPNLTSATSTGFTISASSGNTTPQAAKLAFVQQPSNALIATAIAPAVTVAVQDSNGNTITSATNPVTLALSSGAGLTGTLTATPQNGVATFSNLSESTAGSYTLAASSPNLTSATSSSFTISAPSTTTNGSTIFQSTPISITAAPGGTFEITYNWQAAPVTGSYSVFVDFIDSTGTVQFQDTEQPPVSPSQWNGTLSYTHTVTVPASVATGTYKIVAGLQSSSGYLSMTPGPGVTAFGNGYQTGTLTLAPTCSITSFGAVGDGKTDNLTAIQNTFNSAASNHCIAFIPAGTFAYNGNITANGISVQGTGAASILAPLSLSNQALTLEGSGGSIYNLSMVSTATARLTTPWSSMIWVNTAQNYYIENVLINDGSSTGIISQNSNGGYILNNTVKNTLADSITQVSGSYNITISGNRIMNSGDDGISDNSYVGDPGVVHDITIQGNTVLNNKWGRGLEVSGGSNINFIGNYVDNTDGYSNVYVASESEWNTQSVSNVTVSGNTLVDGGPNQGSTIVYNSEGGSTTITGVTISGNQYVSPQMVAVQLAGAGSETGIQVENNTDYSTNQFSNSSDSAASDTQSGNQVLAPSAYSTPIVAAGGGCNFNGCQQQ